MTPGSENVLGEFIKYLQLHAIHMCISEVGGTAVLCDFTERGSSGPNRLHLRKVSRLTHSHTFNDLSFVREPLSSCFEDPSQLLVKFELATKLVIIILSLFPV